MFDWRYGIREVMPETEFKEYLESPAGRLALFDPHWQPAIKSPEAVILCATVSRQAPSCMTCPAWARLKTEDFTQEECDAYVLTTIGRVRIGAQPAGFVVHQHPLPKFFSAEWKSSFDPSTVARLEALKEADKPDASLILNAVRRAVRGIERRLRLERHLKILGETIERMCAAQESEAILDILFRGLEALLGDVGLCLYALDFDGAIRLVDARGIEETALPRSIPPGFGHIGRVIRDGAALHQGRLTVNPQDFKFTNSSPPPDSSFTVPMRWHSEGAPGALQVTSVKADAFSRAERESIVRLALIASTAATRLFLMESRAHRSPFEPSPSWSSLLISLAIERTGTRIDVLGARRNLYDGVCEEAQRISQASHVSIRLVDAQTGGLRFVSCRGEGWTSEKKQRFYAPDENSAGMRAFLNAKPLYLKDVTKKNDEENNPTPFVTHSGDTQSLYVVPFEVKRQKRGVLTLDWNVKDGGPKEVRVQINLLVDEFENVLEVLTEREHALFRQFEETFSSASENLRAMGDVLVDDLRRMFRAGACSLFLCYPNENDLVLLSTTAPRADGDPLPIYTFGEGLTGWVAKGRRPLRLVDAKDETELKAISEDLWSAAKWAEKIDYSTGYGKHTFLATPLLAKNRLVGVVRLTIKQDQMEFTLEEENLLLEIAARIGQSIDEMWRHQAATERLREMVAPASSAGGDGDLQRIVQALAEDLGRAAEVAGSFIVVADSEIDSETEAACGLLKLMLAEGCPVRSDGPELFTSTFLSADEWAPLANWMKTSWYEPSAIASAARIYLPFEPDSEFRGYLCLAWRNTQFFLEDKRLHLRALAARFASALKPVLVQQRMAAQLKQKLDEVRRIKDVGLELALTHDYTQLMESVLERVIQESGMERGTIRIWEEQSRSWRLEAPFGLSEHEEPRYIPDDPLFQRSADHPLPTLIQNVQEDELWNAYKSNITNEEMRPYLGAIGSSLHIPLRESDRCFGLIFLESKNHTQLSADSLDHLAILSQFIAVAVWFAQDQQLNRPLALLGSMLSGFLHVIRNNLNDIYAHMSLLRLMAKKEVQLTHVVSSLDKYLDRLTDVTEDIARASLNESANVDEIVDVNALIDPVLADFSDRMRHGVVFKTYLDEEHPKVLGSSRLLEMAFRLIVQNALEAMEGGGQLTVRTMYKEDSVVIQFSDTGLGMDEETIKHCFDFFFTTKESAGGTGMGLPVVKGVLLRHRGTVTMSSAPGHGCTVELIMPERKGA